MHAVVFANGEAAYPPDLTERLYQADLIIAADGGSRHCLRLGVTPHLVLGDMDSLTSEEVARLEQQGARLLRYPRRKDATDLELALLWAAQQGARTVDVIAGLGGRWDQSLANLLLAAHPRLDRMQLTFHYGAQRLYPVRREAVIQGEPVDIVSLIPLGGTAEGVTTEGLEYALREGGLPFGASLGVSNVLTASEAHVRVRRGLLLCVVIPAAAQAVLEQAKRAGDTPSTV